MSITLGVPTEKDVAIETQAVRKWVEAWSSWSSPKQISWVSRQWGRLGTQNLPSNLELACPAEIAAVIGQSRRWKTAEYRYQCLIKLWPQLAGQSLVGRYFDVLADYSEEDFLRLFAMLDWLERNPESGLAPRQLPVSGLDTKWLEKRTALITDLLRSIRGTDTQGDFYTMCGLRRPFARVRMRVLCPKLREQVGGLRDIESPVTELSQLLIAPQHILIVENLETGLALPDMDGSVAFMRLGNAVSLLAEFPWVYGPKMVYWGDIDTHGYAILNRARTHFPNLVSVMMDKETFLEYRELWVEETAQAPEAELPLLTEEEMVVFRGLKDGLWGSRLRLEQERISWEKAINKIRKVSAPQQGSPDFEETNTSDGNTCKLTTTTPVF